MLPGLPSLDGPPLRLPPLADRAAEAWAGLPPRARFATLVAAAVAVVMLLGTNVTASPWGPPVEVFVTTQEIAAGAPVNPAHVHRQPWPEQLLPDGHLVELPTGRATTFLPAGTVLSAVHVADGGIAATVAPGHVAVPVTSDLLPLLPVGTRIDVVAADATDGSRLVAPDARVLGSDELFVWLEVEREQAGAVASAAAVGALSVAVLAD